MRRHDGAHPCVGALDVCPVVWLREDDRDARPRARRWRRRGGSPPSTACRCSCTGSSRRSESHRERAFFRSGGLVELRRRLDAGELRPDFGPAELHPTAGATLVTARPPLAAFNVELEGAAIEDAREIAAQPSRVRRRAGRACGRSGSTSTTGAPRCRPTSTTRSRCRSREVVERVRELGRAARRPRRWAPRSSAWSPRRRSTAWPDDVPLAGFDPAQPRRSSDGSSRSGARPAPTRAQCRRRSLAWRSWTLPSSCSITVGVAQRRHVAELAPLGDVAQQAAHDLPRAGLRQVARPDDPLRPGDLRDPLRDVLADLGRPARRSPRGRPPG